MKKKIFLIIFMVIFLLTFYIYGESDNNENFEYKCVITYGEFLSKVRESDKREVKRLIEHYLKKAFDNTIKRLKESIDKGLPEIKNKNNNMSTQSIQNALRDLYNKIKIYSETKDTRNGLKVVIEFDLDKDFLEYLKKRKFTINDFYDP